jgi:benzoyl-CoA reductase/2-hydroxyglutaryl-CoA dehydratase subunit BcrC/BadD/HgdB
MKHEEMYRELLDASEKSQRETYPMEAKKNGMKIIGVISEYVPEELIHAAGMFPWRIRGTCATDTGSAMVYRRPDSCLYCNHVLESLLRGELDFLDGMVAVDIDQDLIRLWDVWDSLGRTSFTYILHAPYNDTEPCQNFFAKEVEKFSSALESYAGASIEENAILSSINVYNKMRELLARVYKLRKKMATPVKGVDVFRLVDAATVMPKETYNEYLEIVLRQLEEAENGQTPNGVRLLLSSDLLDEFGYIDIIEQTGSTVVMDDLDIGSRYIGGQVRTDNSGNIYMQLARRYLDLAMHPRMFSWDRQLNQILEWVKEYRIDGIIEMVQMYSRSRPMRTPFFAKALQKEKVPFLSVRRDYCLSNAEQLKTRIGAFAEMLQQDR